MVDYKRTILTVDRLVSRSGFFGHILRNGSTRFPASDKSRNCVETAFSPQQPGGKIILEGDRRILMSVTGLPDKPDPETDKFVDASGIYRIVTVTPLQPGLIAVFYDLQVRS